MPRTTPIRRFAAVLAQWFAECRRRARERRELAAMRATDWGDLSVPPDLLAHELRRWPWQPPSLGWCEIAAERHAPEPTAGLPAVAHRPVRPRHPLRAALGLPRLSA